MLGLNGSLFRGIGLGLILAGIIFSLGEFEPSKEEIMSKARQYGMLTEKEFREKQKQKDKSSQQTAEPPETVPAEQKPVEQPQPAAEQPKLATGQPKPAPVQPSPAPEEPEQAPSQPHVSDGTIKVIIPRGSNSSQIAQILLANKLIVSADEFLDEVHKMRVSKRFKAGTFVIKSGLSQREIIKELTK